MPFFYGMNDYVVLGDPQTCGQLRQALARKGMSSIDEGGLEIQDEFDAKRWFSRNTPQGTFICIGLLGQTSVANWLFTTAGTINVVRAAVGNSQRLILVSHFPTTEFFLMERLVDLYYYEKQLDFYSVARNTSENTAAFADRCVLLMRDVSATEAHKKSTKGPHQGREVRDQVVPQSPVGKGDAAPAAGREDQGVSQPLTCVLEMQVQAAQGTAPGDLRAQCDPGVGQASADALHPNPAAV